MRIRLCVLIVGVCMALPVTVMAEDVYDVDVNGVPDQVMSGFRNDAQLFRLQEVPVESLDALRRRADVDAETLRVAMRGTGHFGAEVGVVIDDSGEKPVVRLSMEPGEVYKIEDYSLRIEGRDSDGIALARAQMADGTIELPEGDDALVAAVEAPERAVKDVLMQNGHPVPTATRRVLLVNHADNSISADIVLDAGPSVKFGATAITGLKRVKERFLKRRIDWREGDTFDVRKVENTRKNMAATGVVSGTDIVYDPRGHAYMPMTVEIREAKMRSIGAGAAYSTSNGIEASVFWEHRNLFGAAEKLRVALEGGLKTQAFSVAFNKPDMFGSRAFRMDNTFKIAKEDLEAYENQTVASVNTLNWKINPSLEVAGGFGLERSEITPKGIGVKETFSLISFPVLGRFDNTDNALDPREGMKISGGYTPYQSVESPLRFALLDVTASHYWSVTDSLVWANRGRVAMLHGDDLVNIPADKRLYSGGSGSVRGYGYQKLGPVGPDDKPTGGRALLELGTEIRYDITPTIGMVGFVEGGRVTTDVISSETEFYWGGGVGARYKTVAGPIRFDVAVPFNGRSHDDAFQIYIGLGQAF